MKNVAPKKLVTTQKFQEVLKSLSGSQYVNVLNFVEQEVNGQSVLIEAKCEKRYTKIHEALDRNLTAAAILKTDFSLEKINSIFELGLELIKEDNKKVANLNKEGDGDWMKVAENLVDDIRVVTEDLYKKGISKKDSIEILQAEFPKLSKSMITNAYKKTVELIKEGEVIQNKNEEIGNVDKDIEDGLNYIFGNEKEKEEMSVKNLKKEAKKVVEEVVTELEKTIVDSGIVVISKKIEMEIKGQFGIYKVENNKVIIDGAEYNSKEDIETEYKEQLEYLEKSRKEALAVYCIIEKEIGAENA